MTTSLKTQRTPLAKSILLVALLGSSATYAVDFHGYVRSGINESVKGAQQPWVEDKLGRFGNETDGWWAMQFNQELPSGEKGKSFGAYTEITGDTPLTGNDDWNYGDTYGPNGHMGLTQYYITAKGYITSLPDTTLWVGKRSYDKREVPMLDYKPVTSAGNGFGLEGIDVGPGKLAIAYIRNDQNSSSYKTYSETKTYDSSGAQTGSFFEEKSNNTKYNVNNVDVQYTKIPLVSDATMDVIGQFSMVDKNDEQTSLEKSNAIQKAENAFIPTFVITKPLGQGYNQTTVQYAIKRFANNLVTLGYNDTYRTSFDNDYSKAKAFRVINEGEFFLTDNISIDHAVAYSTGNDITPELNSVNAFNAVVRPSYLWDKNNKTALELGWFKQKNNTTVGDKNEQGKKVTLAHVISAGPTIFARPEFRFYTTYMKADKNEIDGWTFNNGKNSQVNFGVQVEAWW
jgi:maltoporin